MKTKKILSNQKGFTLIEIIAVLIIMGILAAVAVPKYFDLTQDAQEKAINAAGAEVQARLNLHFAEQLLSAAGDCSTALGALSAGGIGSDLGDFSVDLTNLSTSSGATYSITIQDLKNNYSDSFTLRNPVCGD